MTTPKVDQGSAGELAEYGITRVPVDYFHYRGFRYTNLADAIAEARRQKPPTSGAKEH